MIDRRRVVGAMGAGLLGSAPAIRATGIARRRPRIGILSGMPEPLIERLRALGWIDGRTIDLVISPLGATDASARREGAEFLARADVDLMVGSNNQSIAELVRASRDTPIVMAGTIDPVAAGWAHSLAKPGGRLTGTAWEQDARITRKYPELLGEIVPGLTRLGAIIPPSFPGMDRYRTELEAASLSMGIETFHAQAGSPEDVAPAFAQLASARVQAVFVYGSPVSYLYPERFVAEANKRRLPTMYIFRQVVDAGGLIAYGASWVELTRRAGDFVDKVLRGAKPADLPIELPSTYELVVSRRAAREIGIRLPQSILARADEVIE